MIDFFLVWEAENFTMIGLQRRRAQRQRGDIFWWQDNNWFHCVQLRGPAQLSHYDKTLTVLKTDLPKLNSKTLERFRLSIWASSYQNWHDVSTVLDVEKTMDQESLAIAEIAGTLQRKVQVKVKLPWTSIVERSPSYCKYRIN